MADLAPNVSERATYQEHWRDLCALPGEFTPSRDTTGQDYAFEKYIEKIGTGETDFDDVFKRNDLTAEYKAQVKSPRKP
ncbi:hypothetical protein [Deinococcus marmoris]|uniref:Uncharacterized protein n=1 Tax=Deinococcus marmoris TaxID=249408 RepID=A0A1U7P598_9DEIO|nr:hypothetical protein [Deinococcus marmoris]OLV20328.1 hypothetical protein BOO71_0000040 [Deinococcus marmoris]